MIENCQNLHKTTENLEFHHLSVTDFQLNQRFHVATAVFVLQYVHEKEELKRSIQLIWDHLEENGIFIGLIPNGIEGVNAPKTAGKVLGAEIEKRPIPFVDGGLVTANFYEGDKIKCTSTMALHSNSFYEQCFQEAGFKKFEWLSPKISEKGKEILGKEFCDQFMNPPCDIVFRVFK
uniref:Methyltransf_11 domain-containing protein n=1 Tax=Caenorhabditis tropicalis TaxID=1561998 RepID=A0A1I7UFN9_9PELO